MFFKDRAEAGRKLAQKLAKRLKRAEKARAIVLALPRGGVPVACEIAQKLGADLDVIVAHKLGAPGNEEFAIGAVAEDGSVFLDTYSSSGIPADYIKAETARQIMEIHRRITKYRQDRKLKIKGRTVILADDGIATGHTMSAALLFAKKAGAGRVIIAVSVLPPDALANFEKQGAEVVYLSAPLPFLAIGRFYEDFSQLSDEEVQGYLDKYKKRPLRGRNIKNRKKFF